jgi:RNA polymerase sigma-70 factor, ECF subfamily
MPEIVQIEGGFAHAALVCLDGLYRYAMALSHNQAEAEDLVQETYLRAVRASGQLAPDSNLKSWLYAILRNAWLNQVRHAHSGPRFVDMDDDQESGAAGQVRSNDDPYATYVRHVEHDHVRAAVNNLPPQYREVIVLREFEGLSYQEIGVILDCPAGTVMSRLSRARDRLREALSDWGGSGFGPKDAPAGDANSYGCM